MSQRRRDFLKQSALILAGVSAGAVNCWTYSFANQPSSLVGGRVTKNAVASFGWEVQQLNNSGANVHFLVSKKMVLLSADIDTALMVVSLPPKPGALEVLCSGAVSRGTAPKFAKSGPVYLPKTKSSDFGSVTLENPNKLQYGLDDHLAQDFFYSVILKAWVPIDGSASSTARHVRAEPSLTLNRGDYLLFHMDHMGVPCDGEMQVVLTYTLV